jgi:hypothetical protein
MIKPNISPSQLSIPSLPSRREVVPDPIQDKTMTELQREDSDVGVQALDLRTQGPLGNSYRERDDDREGR